MCSRKAAHGGRIANQIIVALNIAAVAEALLFDSKAGADPAMVRQALMGGFASSRILRSARRMHGHMIKRTFEPGFRIRLHQKDLGLALQGAREPRLPVPQTEPPVHGERPFALLDAGRVARRDLISQPASRSDVDVPARACDAAQAAAGTGAMRIEHDIRAVAALVVDGADRAPQMAYCTAAPSAASPGTALAQTRRQHIQVVVKR